MTTAYGLPASQPAPSLAPMTQPTRFVVSAGLIAALTLASRVFGLVREMVFGYYLGTSGVLSAFRIAFQVPNLTRRLFGEGALSSAVIPVLTATLQGRGELESRRFIGSVITALLAVLGAGIVVVEVGLWIWRSYQDDLTLRLTQLLLPYAALICTVAVVSGCLQVRQRFGVPAFVPILLNVFEIAALALGAAWKWPELELIYLVCGAVLLAGLVQLGLTAVALRSASLFPLLNFAWRDEHVRKVVRLMGPMALGLAAVQINTLTDNIIAYLFIVDEAGERVGPAILGYAQILYQLPLGVVGISIATAIFPLLSLQAAAKDLNALARTFERGIRLSLFIALPAGVGLIAVANPLVTLLLERGEFTAADTRRVAGTLVFYSLGMAAYFTQHVVIRTFYSMHDSKTPARIALVFVVLDIVLNLFLVRIMQERGLALTTAFCATVQVFWLGALLSRIVPTIFWGRILAGSKGVLLATLIMTGGLTVAHLVIDSLRLSAPLEVGGLVLVGVASYAGAAWVLQIEELRDVLRRSNAERET